MAENLKKVPKKSSLKKNGDESNAKQCKWDEMNILETYHPENKDYGHMKIDEPKTPYNYDMAIQEEAQEQGGKAAGREAVCAKELAERLQGDLVPRALAQDMEDDEDDMEEKLTPEEEAQKRKFEAKRKAHYNEFLAVQRARQMRHESDEEEEEDVDATG